MDILAQDRNAGNKLYKRDPTKYLDLNLKFFSVPFCRGKLEFDPKYFEIVEESCRQGDIIKELNRELKGLKV